MRPHFLLPLIFLGLREIESQGLTFTFSFSKYSTHPFLGICEDFHSGDLPGLDRKMNNHKEANVPQWKILLAFTFPVKQPFLVPGDWWAPASLPVWWAQGSGEGVFLRRVITESGHPSCARFAVCFHHCWVLTVAATLRGVSGDSCPQSSALGIVMLSGLSAWGTYL